MGERLTQGSVMGASECQKFLPLVDRKRMKRIITH